MTVEARLTCGGVCRTIPLTQYDEGQKIHLNGITLPASYLAEFANSEMGTAEQITQTTDTVTVPDKYLTSGSPVYVWIVVVGEDERTTRYEIIVPVKGRGEPDDYTPTPEEQTAIEAAIAALNAAVVDAEAAIEHYPRITDGVWQVWDVSSGEWISTEVPAQGPQGETGATGNGIASAVLNADYTLTLTFTNGTTYTTPSIRGAQGAQGQDGAPGADGYSPTASVSKSGNTATITITDKDGTTTAQVSDGATGQTGPAGADGYSPTATVTKSGDTATISITDKNGTTTAQISDGQNGQDGQQGPAGPGVPSGGSAGDVLVKKTGTDYDTEWSDDLSYLTNVADITVGNTSAVYNHAVKFSNGVFYYSNTSKQITINGAVTNEIKTGTNDEKPIVPNRQHDSVFYGLAKAAGDSTQSASSNAVGTYTDAAKVAIQKMLGIYQAPWELIREDTVTNATEADIEIAVDGNGNAFELTDVICLFETPVQDIASAKGSYGLILCYYDKTKYLSFECGSWTQAANSSAHTCGGILTQNDNIVSVEIIVQGAGGARASVNRRIYPSLTQSSAQSIFIPSNILIFTKVNIKAVTGTGHYKLYGKRKWT